jgi:putative tricarboxylic transport membrane protein
MDVFGNVLFGFQVVLQPDKLVYCFLGCLFGTLVGVLPGLGAPAAIALLLPSTFHMDPVSATIMLAGIYYGSMYGGSTTSILVNIPGETASVVTCLDGYQMAKQGRAGPALGISAFGSFIAGTVGIFLLLFLSPPLASLAIRFGPPEYFSLMVLGLTILTFMAKGSMIKSLMMACLGLILGTVGTDPISGQYRFTFNRLCLYDGFGLVPITMGLFGISEVLVNIEQGMQREIFRTHLKGLLPSVKDWVASKGAIIRGTFIGFFLGILPGGGAVVSSFASYALEKKISKNPEKFGTGVIEGVAGPETANNAGSTGAFIPLLTLGLPSNVATAILLGALMIYGLQPGPLLIEKHPDVFWGVVCSMYVGNVMLLVLNLPLINLWVRFLKIPYKIFFPFILLFCLIGVYSLNNNISDIIIMVIFGILGYLMKKFEYEGAPLILALVLGPMMENALRQSLMISRGSFLIFFSRPISLILLSAAILFLLFPLIGFGRIMRSKVGLDEGE